MPADAEYFDALVREVLDSIDPRLVAWARESVTAGLNGKLRSEWCRYIRRVRDLEVRLATIEATCRNALAPGPTSEPDPDSLPTAGAQLCPNCETLVTVDLPASYARLRLEYDALRDQLEALRGPPPDLP